MRGSCRWCCARFALDDPCTGAGVRRDAPGRLPQLCGAHDYAESRSAPVSIISMDQRVETGQSGVAVSIIRSSLRCAMHFKERRYGQHEGEGPEAGTDGRRGFGAIDCGVRVQPRGSGVQRPNDQGLYGFRPPLCGMGLRRRPTVGRPRQGSGRRLRSTSLPMHGGAPVAQRVGEVRETRGPARRVSRRAWCCPGGAAGPG